MKKTIIKTGILSAILLPILTLADTTAPTDLKGLIDIVIQYLGYAVYLIMGLAIVMFVWNVYRYFIAGGEEKNKTEAGLYVMWSIIAFFIIALFYETKNNNIIILL